jgi:ADP-ribose pyrophosphatase YjhB (NUDIX family)
MLLIVTDDGRLLLHHRDDKPGIAHPGCWAGFGGAVEEGESVEEVA